MRKSFFFSSRRRHTRYIGDWSSDVCSSDLQSIDVPAVEALNDFAVAHHGPAHAAQRDALARGALAEAAADRKSTRLNSSHRCISYAVFCLKKKKHQHVPRNARTARACAR